jgi:hypothetical protein
MISSIAPRRSLPLFRTNWGNYIVIRNVIIIFAFSTTEIMFEDWQERIKKNPQVYKGLLWDVNTSNLNDDDWQRMKLFVVHRVVELGDTSDWYAIFKLYGGFDGVREAIKQIRSVLHPRNESFVRLVFDLKKEDLICYERKRLRELHLNS